ncbi:MAG: hypothetical protein RR835_02840 [Peptostreptococcaceae bacterium]
MKEKIFTPDLIIFAILCLTISLVIRSFYINLDYRFIKEVKGEVISKNITIKNQYGYKGYSVKINYKNNNTIVDSEELFYIVEVGDTIRVNYYESKDGEHSFIKYKYR